MHVLGIDIGGSGIKGALVNPGSGRFASDRIRIETPPGWPKFAMAQAGASTARCSPSRWAPASVQDCSCMASSCQISRSASFS